MKFEELKEIVQISRGVPTSRTSTEGEVPVHSVASLISNREANVFIGRDEIKNCGALLSEPKDILVSVEGGSVGETFLVASDTHLFIPSQQAATIRILDPKVLLPEFVAAWLQSPIGNQQLLRLSRGTSIQRIALVDLKNLTVPLAPIEVQTSLGEVLLGFDNAIASHRKVIEHLAELRDIELSLFFDDEQFGANSQESNS